MGNAKRPTFYVEPKNANQKGQNSAKLFLYSVGVIPNFFLKIRQKYGVSVRPTDAPISYMDWLIKQM